MNIKKTYCIIAQAILLIWFFLDMTGFYIGGECLVTRAYEEDGIFFLIWLAAVILFIVQEKVGAWVCTVWLSLWFVLQFLNHEWYTIFNDGFMGSTEGKIRYFSGTIRWLRIEGRYIPDLYHTVLHILILTALVCTILYAVKMRRAKK